MVKRSKSTISLTDEARAWVAKEAKRRGICKNAVIQELINKAMEEKPTTQTPTDPTNM